MVKQLEVGSVICHCGHWGIPGHFWAYLDPPKFKRPDGTVCQPDFKFGCNECVQLHGEDFLIRGDYTIDEDDEIDVNPDSPDRLNPSN